MIKKTCNIRFLLNTTYTHLIFYGSTDVESVLVSTTQTMASASGVVEKAGGFAIKQALKNPSNQD